MRKLFIIIFLLRVHTLFGQTELRIDPETSVGCAVSQLFEQVEYYPLETTKESLFGKIDQLYVTDEYYIILDKDTNSILVFLKNGKFYTRISCGPQALNEGARFFVVDKLKRQIKVGFYFNKFKVFDFEGKFIENKTSEIEFENFYPLSPDTDIYYSLNYDYKKSKQNKTDNELKYINNGKVQKQFFPFENYNRIIGNKDLLSTPNSFFTETGIDGTVTFTRYYNYNIYTADTTDIHCDYTFIFPMNRSLPVDFLKNRQYYNKRINYISDHRLTIYGISYFFKFEQLLFFKIKDLSNKNASYVYDLASGTLISTDHIESDSTNYFLPLTKSGNFTTSNFGIYSFLTTDGTALYASVSSREMYRAKEQTAEKKLTYSNKLDEYFKYNTIKSNPVIIRLKPRSQFSVL
jgi:hypothetical protein